MNRINKLIDSIDENKNKLEQIKSDIVTLKKANKQHKKEIITVLEDIGLDALKNNDIINHLYWHEGFSMKSLSNALGVKNKTLNITPKLQTVCCSYCKFEYEIVKDLKNKGNDECPKCVDRRIKQKKDHIQRVEQSKINEEKYLSKVYKLHTMPYYEYLQTPEWKQTSYDAMKKVGFKCQLCGTSGKTLNTHHNTYERRGYEIPSDLMVLCEECHGTYSKKGG